ncbi:protein kinase domain-containing protein [Radiobacillus sp. PE A8.2]|uniref:protein kinase domain-containing protein n=1 Tax=Radiobacillus sp. PE A8.2 TaxID=3380349 RepID=UPI00388F8857
MNQTSKKQAIDIKVGSVIVGKWHKNRYTVKKQLGQGAIGSVYLCEHNGKPQALKISDKSSSVTMEVNVLKTLQKVQGSRLGPSLLDVDDWVDMRGNRYSFYVMEYLKGITLPTFIQRSGKEWLGILMMQLLTDLESLHQAGWVFGDLKTDNLLVVSSPARIRWIDVGGTTQIGRSIKEYTEFYDRGYWKMGSRRAEPSYDLFALAMIMLQIYHPNRFERGTNPQKTLLLKLSKTSELDIYKPVIQKAIQGHYLSSDQMKRDLNTLIMKNQHNTAPQASSHARGNVVTRQSRQVSNQPKSHTFLESMGISVAVLLFYLFYLVVQ